MPDPQPVSHADPAAIEAHGLFRTALAHHGAPLTEAYRRLREDPRCVSAPALGLYGRTVDVPGKTGEGDEGAWKMISLRDEIFVAISDCQYARARTELVPPEGFVEFHYLVTGPAHVGVDDTDHVQVDAPNGIICYQGAGLHYQITCPQGPRRALGLYVSSRYFQRLLDALGVEGEPIRARLAAVKADELYHLQMRLTLEAVQSIEQLLASAHRGVRELLFVEAKCLAILYASVGVWTDSLRASAPDEILSARDLMLMERARRMIDDDLKKTMTIPDLARAVGTNASKLKRAFKFLHGVTVFEYSLRRRMQEALRLLVDERQAVGQVAAAVGYQHQTSFTTSFRDFYGFAPKDARQLRGGERAPASDPVRGEALHADPRD
ncbi:helix-turn-helix transcriptional regulator [Paraburkholderia acidisoli]|uniref:helix-turn-helix transcriptional regulator n=1 Tax=Paraburkholderia acidisoli TaxID=2571748 RepID=UPI001E2A8D6D|nr:AraC family transcriptional regulator [Paraburkholderia acidisoli]